MNKTYINWQDVEGYIKEIANRLKDKPTGIFTFPKGGLVLAVMLANYLENKNNWKIPILMNPVKGCVIIDDIFDTGITARKYLELKEKESYYITFMHIKKDRLFDERNITNIDFSWGIKEDAWIIYPWEMERE